MHVSHLLSFLHADNHALRLVHAADTQAWHVGVDACCKVAEARGQHVAHLIWHQLVHHAAHQHHRCCDGCCRGDGLLVGLDGLVVGRHGREQVLAPSLALFICELLFLFVLGNCARQVSWKGEEESFSSQPVSSLRPLLPACILRVG